MTYKSYVPIKTDKYSFVEKLYSKWLWCEDFYKTLNTHKREHRKDQKRMSLLRTLTTNRPMVVMSIMDIIADFGDIRTLIPETSRHHIGIIRIAYRKHPDTLPG